MAPLAGVWLSPSARRRRNRQRGQALVLVVLSIVVLLGMAAVAVDAGRFLTQKRFLQNAADAAALAAANSVVANAANPTATVLTAKDAARAILAIDLAGSAVGAPTFTAAEPAQFSGTPSAATLVDGIVLADAGGTPLADTGSLDNVADIRVALRGPVDFTLGRVVGLNQGSVSAHARVGFVGQALPIAVRRYYNPPGPNAAPPSPCPEPPSSSQFTDLAATQATSCEGQQDTSDILAYGGRTPASPSSPGPTIILVGQGATADNDNSFRGFVTLDIRNFNDEASRVYYNGVTAGMSQNALKDFESNWISTLGGYPGPDFPPVTIPPDPNDQVGIMDGNSAGIVVDSINSRFRVGAKVLCALYDGTVMSIPDFSMTTPSPIALTAGGTATDASSFAVDPNNQFFSDGGQVTVDLLSKPAFVDPTPVTFSVSSPFSPDRNGTTVRVASIKAVAAPSPAAQLATAWIRGHSASPYLKDHYQPVLLTIGGASTSALTLTPSADAAPAAWGGTVSFTLTVTKTVQSDFPSGVTVSLLAPGAIDSSTTPFPNIAANSYWFDDLPGRTQSTVTSWTQNGTGSHATWTATTKVTIDTSKLGATNSYPIVFDAAAVGGGVDVQAQARVLASGTTDDSSYVDIVGFAVYEITAISSNSVTGQAVSEIRPSMSDSKLRAALTPRLIPW